MKKFKSLILALIISVSFSFPAFAGELTFPFFCWYDSSGYPLASGKLYSYVSGTSTPKLLYSDKATTTPHTNPEILDTNGCTEIYGLGTYTLTLKDSTDTTTYFSIDDVVAGGQGGSVSYHYPNYGAVDQGATGNNDTIKYAIDTCSTDACTIYLANNSGSARTEYVLDTDETAGSSIKFIFEEGAELKPASGDTLTIYSAAHIQARPTQQIIDLTNNTTNPLLLTEPELGITEAGWFGPAGDDSTDDLNALQAAITAGAGGKIHIPNPASKYKITDELDIATANTILYGDSMTDTIIRQDTWEQPVIEIRGADGAQVRNLYLQDTNAKASISGTVDEEPARDYCSGVYIANSDDVVVENVTVDGLVNGVKWRGETDNTNLSKRNRINNVVVHGSDMGVLMQGQQDFSISKLTAIDSTRSQGIGIHAIYATPGVAYLKSTGTISDVKASMTSKISTGDSAIQLKYCDGCVVSNLTALRWPAVIDIVSSSGVYMSNIVGIDLGSDTNNAVTIEAGTDNTWADTEGNVIDGLYLESSVDGKQFITIEDSIRSNDGDSDGGTFDNIIRNVTIIDDSSSATGGVAFLRGTRNEMSNVNVRCKTTAREVVRIAWAKDCRIKDFRTTNTISQFVYIDDGSAGTTIEFNSDWINSGVGTDDLITDLGSNSVIHDHSITIKDLQDQANPDVSFGNVFRTTGTTTINRFNEGWIDKQITILAETALDIGYADNNMYLLGSGAFTMANGDALTMVYKRDVATEHLSETDFATHANWDVTGDVDDSGGNAAFTFAAGSLNGTLKQVNADQANTVTNGNWYVFQYTVAVTTAPDGDFALTLTGDTGEIPNVDQKLPIWAGTHRVKFVADSAGATGDFTLTASETTATQGVFTLDDVSLMKLKWFEVSRFDES